MGDLLQDIEFQLGIETVVCFQVGRELEIRLPRLDFHRHKTAGSFLDPLADNAGPSKREVTLQREKLLELVVLNLKEMSDVSTWSKPSEPWAATHASVIGVGTKNISCSLGLALHKVAESDSLTTTGL